MKTSKEKISKLIYYLAIIFVLYKIIDFVYYYSFEGNQDIHFLNIMETDTYNYEEIFELNQFKDKYVYVTLNNRADWERFREDIKAMEKLHERFNNKDLVFLYTADDIDGILNNYEWKKLIKKFDLKGYHINLPQGYEWNLQYSTKADTGRVTHFPKYMIVSDKGKIIKKTATRPKNTEKLIFELDSIMK